MAQATIELRAVHKQYGQATAVVDANLGITEGELVAVIGPSGAGKSTLLKLVAGEETPTQGEVYIAGRRVTDLSPSARGVAVVYQDYSLFPHLSVSDNVAFPMEARAARGPFAFAGGDSGAISDRVVGLLNEVNLSRHARKKPDELSGGEQQRAAIARAIGMNPKLICFDEPFSALDSILRLRLRRQVMDLKSASSGTFLYVTHNVEEAFSLADRIVVMVEGRIAQVDCPQDLYWKPRSKLIAELTGNVCFLEVATVAPDAQGVRCATAAGNEFGLRGISVNPGDLLGFRPETVTIAGDEARVRGKVKNVTFEGVMTRVVVALQGNDELALAIPSYAAPALHPGMEIGLSWEDRNCFVVTESRSLS